MRFAELWKWEGTVGRGAYAMVGFLGFAIKHNLDRVLATFGFGREWGLFNYWIPLDQAAQITELSPSDARFLLTMVLFSLPFIAVGFSLTVRRLRSAGQPVWLAVLFFAPFINLVFFLLLCVLPGRQPKLAPEARRPSDRILDRVIPEHAMGSAAIASGVTALAGVTLAGIGLFWFSVYGWGLFVALPFCLGLFSVLLYGYHRPRGAGQCLLVASASVGLVSAGLLALAWEGIVCIAMAAPLGMGLALLGAWAGYVIQRRAWSSAPAPAALAVLLAATPMLMGAEQAARPVAAELKVVTVLDAGAPPEVVWENVVAFTELAEPKDWLFRLGIAYPTRAEIHGYGAGAERHCVFSTGAFVEPIEVWDAPRLLKFSVISNPAPMQEWTPYRAVHPPHLEGYFVASGGQFHLVPLSGGGTRIEATTWYHHRLWPGAYWKLWSDEIIHRIHLRVLRHVAQQAELRHAKRAP